MPYKVFETGGKSSPFCVYKIDEEGNPVGDSLGCHPSKQKAQSQITAILISESEGKSMSEKTSYLRAFMIRAGAGDQDPTAPIRFVASTEGIKDDGFDLKASDWLLGRYEKHPVVLYAHDYLGTNLPLGSGKPFIDGSRLMIDVSFDPEDDFARKVRAKTVKGLMGGSVGWRKIDNGNELLEFSIVPVPLDPEALPLRQATGRRAFQDWLNSYVTEEITDEEDQAGGEELPPQDQGGGVRIGAVLSSRNLKDLESARDLISGVIDRSKKEAGKEEAEDEGRSISALQSIKDQLFNLGDKQ